MDLHQKEAFLRHTFREADKTDIHRLATLASEAYFPKKSTVLSTGEPMQETYLIVSGIARSYYITDSGRDHTKLFMAEGEFMLGESLFMHRSLESFETIEEVRCLRFKSTQLRATLEATPASSALYIKLLEDTLVYKMNREYTLQCLPATERYREFLSLHPGLEKRVPQYLIASYLGITKESLSRIRRKLT